MKTNIKIKKVVIKTVLDRAVFDQIIQTASWSKELFDYRVIGYCVADEKKWIVFYSKDLNDLKKMIMFDKIYPDYVDKNSENYLFVAVVYDNTGCVLHKRESEDDCQGFIKQMLAIKSRAFQLGQFFL
jgi:hypothetical protein